MIPPRSVLACYRPALDGLRWRRAPGGFSGAAVWRGEDGAGNPLFALKQWPEGFPAARVAEIHAWVARSAHLPFVPRVLPTAEGNTLVEESGRVWDATRWMPGAASESPSDAEVRAACAAVAQLHTAWRTGERREPAPGVLNRLRVLRGWLERPVPVPPRRAIPPELREVIGQAVGVVAAAGPPALRTLEPWAEVCVPVQTCVRDLRGEHVLFREVAVAGLVDFGAAAPDYPGVDLARLLSDCAGPDEERFGAGLNAYRGAGGTLDEPDAFVRALERSGSVCSVIGWLLRVTEGQMYAAPIAVRNRLSQLLGRLAPARAGG